MVAAWVRNNHFFASYSVLDLVVAEQQTPNLNNVDPHIVNTTAVLRICKIFFQIQRAACFLQIWLIAM